MNSSLGLVNFNFFRVGTRELVVVKLALEILGRLGIRRVLVVEHVHLAALPIDDGAVADFFGTFCQSGLGFGSRYGGVRFVYVALWAHHNGLALREARDLRRFLWRLRDGRAGERKRKTRSRNDGRSGGMHQSSLPCAHGLRRLARASMVSFAPPAFRPIRREPTPSNAWPPTYRSVRNARPGQTNASGR